MNGLLFATFLHWFHCCHFSYYTQRLKEAIRISKAENFFNLRQCIHNVCIEFLYREIEKKKYFLKIFKYYEKCQTRSYCIVCIDGIHIGYGFRCQLAKIKLFATDHRASLGELQS